MSEEKAEKTFQEYRAPDDQKEENLQMAQAPTVETTEEDDIPDSIDDCDSDKENTIAKNTGEGVEPVVGALGYDHDPTYVLDGQVPSTSHDMAARNLNLLNVELDQDLV